MSQYSGNLGWLPVPHATLGSRACIKKSGKYQVHIMLGRIDRNMVLRYTWLISTIPTSQLSGSTKNDC
jgi:hypothetical protein